MNAVRRRRALLLLCMAVGLIVFVFVRSDVEVDLRTGDQVQGRVEVKKKHRIALLIYGVRLETLFDTGKSIRKYLVDLHDADVFVYGREVAEYRTAAAVKSAFGNRVKGIFLGQQLSEEEIEAILKTAKRHKELTEVCGGSNMLKPGTLNGLVWSQLVYELAAAYERHHGFEYDYMIYMRPDVEWFAPFPPPEMLDSKYQMWIPTRTPWGGIPASLIVCPRGLCEHWSSWWNKLRNGTIVEELQAANQWTQRNCMASEMLEHAYWKAHNVPFGWFSAVYTIVCTHTLCKNGDQCYLGRSICEKNQKYKYDGQVSWFEATLARKNAARIRRDGWTPKELTYNCHTTVEDIKAFRREFKKTGIEKMMPLHPDANAFHPEPPWSPVDGSVNI